MGLEQQNNISEGPGKYFEMIMVLDNNTYFG